MYFCLSSQEVRKLVVYSCTKICKYDFLKSWTECQMAKVNSYANVLKRIPLLSITVPRATSLSKAISFNRTNVMSSFEKCIESHQCWSVRHLECRLDGNNNHSKDKKSYCSSILSTNSENDLQRKRHTGYWVAANAAENSIPSFITFSRKKFNEYFVRVK